MVYKFTIALSLSAVLIGVNGQAQVCGTDVPSQQWEQEFQKLIAKSFPTETARKQTAQYTIPVIIHVIHGGQAVGTYPNLAQGQLISQIKVLNDDFGGVGYNSGNYNAQAFVNWANSAALSAANLDALGRVGIANCGVQFCLATKDTNGNILPEPGIDRVNYVTRGWANPASSTTNNSFKTLIDGVVKPGTIWNVSRYMNIWVTDENINAIGLLGYATFPSFSTLSGIPGSFGTATTDGFWCYAKAFGSIAEYPSGSYTGTNKYGRTSTHEIGHYLGLRHIWGDGNCATDYCDDTPPASDKNFNTAVYPWKVASCATTNAPDGEMFMNFMDYTNDDIKYMYTPDQALRVQTVMSNSPYRKFLGTHNLCTVKEYSAQSAFSAPLSVCGTSAAITLSNQSSGTPVPTYTWNVSGGASIFPNINSPVAAINFPSAGSYTIILSADNGTLNTSQKVVNVYVPSITVAGGAPTECEGKEIVLTATGGNYYSWLPGGIITSTMAFTASGVTSYSVVSFGPGNCKTSTLVTVEATDCSGLSQNVNQLKELTLSPNPAYSHVLVRVPSRLGHLAILDITGKAIWSEQVNSTTLQIELDLHEIDAGVYFVRWQGEQGEEKVSRLIKQ